MIAAALEELDLSAVLAAMRDQEAHGHTAESDAELPLAFFASKLVCFGQAAADAMRQGDKPDLDIAYRRCARDAALAIATMRRIRLEQQRSTTHHV